MSASGALPAPSTHNKLADAAVRKLRTDVRYMMDVIAGVRYEKLSHAEEAMYTYGFFSKAVRVKQLVQKGHYVVDRKGRIYHRGLKVGYASLVNEISKLNIRHLDEEHLRDVLAELTAATGITP
jgi:hypothetical protein